jgi:putative PEP-CTERM system TPR-repeat lipoprotein
MRLRGHWSAIVLALALAGCSKSAAQYFESGNKYFADKKYREAIVEYRNAIQQQANHGEAHLKLAEACMQVGDVQNAYREYVRAADLLPGNAGAQIKAGTLLLLAGRFEDAKARAEKVLARDARNVDAQILLGNATAGLKDLDTAIKEIEEAIALAPKESRTYANLGALQLARGDAAAAEAAFKKAIETDPKSVPARLAAANFYWANGRRGEAEAELEQAHAIDAADVRTNRALASLYVASGRVPEAEPYLKAVADKTKSPGASLSLADYYVFSKRSGEAVALLKAIAGQKEYFALATARLAGIHYAEGRPSEAHKAIDDVLAREPNNAAAILVKAQFLLQENKVDEALARARAAAAADGKSAQAQYMLGTIYAAKNLPDEAIEAFNEVLKINPRATAAQIQISRLQLAKGAATPAVDFAQQAVSAEPGNPVARLLLARSLMAKGDLPRAESEMTGLVERFPKASPVHAQMGALHVLRKDPVNARRSYETAIQLDPNSMEAAAGLATLDIMAKRVPEARARVDARLARMPTDAQTLMLAARVYGMTGDVARAEQLLVKTVEVAPETLDAYGMLGQIYIQQRKLDQAREKFEELGRRQTRPVAAETMVGMILQMQGRNAEAQKHYERVVEMDPRAPVAANNLAWMYAEGGGNLDVALQLAQSAKAALPDSPEINDTLGWIYWKKGLGAMAVPPLLEAVEKAPKNPVYHYHLGLAYAKNQEPAKAQVSLETALRLDPNFSNAADARKLLASLQQ